MLLVTGIIGVLVGWIVDRQRWRREISELKTVRSIRDEKIYIGASITASASRFFEILDSMEAIPDVPEENPRVKELLVDEFLSIYRNQDAIEFEEGFPNIKIDARCFARDALYHLDCDDSVDQFFTVARSLKWYKEYDEIHNLSSDQFKSLERFVSDTIAVKDQIYANGFENDPRDK